MGKISLGLVTELTWLRLGKDGEFKNCGFSLGNYRGYGKRKPMLTVIENGKQTVVPHVRVTCCITSR